MRHGLKYRLETFLAKRGIAVTRLTMILGATTVLGTFGIGYQAYVSSRNAILSNIYQSNLELARAFRDYANAENSQITNSNVLNNLRSIWAGIDRSYEGGFLCVVDAEGKLTLHTATPDREGVNVGGNVVHPDNPTTLNQLIRQKQDYVGPYLSSAGRRQIAAFSYVPSLQSVVSVHVPYEIIEAQVHEASLPWLISLIIIGAVLMPFSMWFLHCAYMGAQRRLQEANSFLNKEISEHAKVQQELLQHRHHLEKLVADRTTALTAANEELESFSYSVSHDLRSPLRSIDGFSLALLEDCQDKLSEDGRNYLQRVRRSVQHMGDLIDALLRLSRVTRGSLNIQSVDLSELARTIMKEIRGNEPERDAEVHIAPGLMASADVHLVNIVLENLLSNAWKYSSKLEHAVIEFGKFEQDGEEVFYIKDNGAGFDMQYANKLFGAFQRLHKANDFPGTGIGLATVERIVHRHGGRIWAEGEIDKGATIYFTLPSLAETVGVAL